MRTQLEQKYGADNTIYDVNERANFDYSRFDFSRKNNTTFDIGQVIPIDWFRVFPGDKVDLTNRYIIDTFPLVNTPFTNYRVRIQWYGIELSGLHKGWQSFISQGRKGSVSIKQLPVIKETARVLKSPHVFLPSSLASHLSLPVLEASKDEKFNYVDPYYVSSDSSTDSVEQIPNRHFPVNGVNLMPFLFYQKIFRHGILPQNLLQDNEIWLPEDLSEEWRFDYLAKNVNSNGYFVPQGTPPDGTEGNEIVANPVPTVDDTAVDLLSLRYACFDRDYFTESKPWLVRGDAQGSADLNVSNFVGGLDISSIIDDSTIQLAASGINTSFTANIGVTNETIDNVYTPTITYNGQNLPAQSERPSYKTALKDLYSRITFAKSSSAKASLTANSLRTMIAYSVWQERNALTNGNYNEFIKAHFNENPRKPDYEPVYLGGMSNMMNFGQVLQTSASESSPLGTQAGLGSSSGQQKLFHFEAKNFGYLMGVMFVVPEVYYTQGVGHEWTDVNPEDWFMPEFSKTGFEPILNQEIFPQNTEEDLGLFGYQTRSCYLKARQNRASGMFAVPSEYDKLFSTYVQAREFASLPKLSLQFVSCSPENVRRDFLAYTKYPAFKLQIASDVRLVRALPYASTPETFGF